MESFSENHDWELVPSWLGIKSAERWHDQINAEICWEQPTINIYGNSYSVPRLTAFLAQKEISYRYSGVVHHGNGWPEWFMPLLREINLFCKVKFNGCLINCYRNGNDRMGWHSDDEPEIDESKPIASLSLGAKRDILFRHRKQKFREIISLNSGDLLIMHPNAQINWFHSIPARKKIKNSRINLTFRCYKRCI